MKVTILILMLALTVHGQTRPKTRRAPVKPAQTPSTTPPAPMLPVIVKLRSGKDVSGKFAGANDHSLTLTTDSGSLEIQLRDVVSVHFSAPVPVADNSAAREAIKSLRRLDSAVSVGLTYREYGTRLVDTKIAVDEQVEKIVEGEPKVEIMQAMIDYQKASELWELKVTEGPGYKNGGVIEPNSSELEVLRRDYPEVRSIEVEERTHTIMISIDELLTVVWRSARKHIDKATSLLR